MGNKGQLNIKKEKQMEDLGVVWDVLSQQWENNFILLVKYKDREGDCNVPNDHKEDGENLGNWLNNQRQANNNGKIDTQKQKQLESLGVVWDILSQQWENNFNLLVKYKDREGHCNVPRRHKEDGKNLGAWLSKQRTANRNGKIDTQKQKVLDDLGVIWSFMN